MPLAVSCLLNRELDGSGASAKRVAVWPEPLRANLDMPLQQIDGKEISAARMPGATVIGHASSVVAACPAGNFANEKRRACSTRSATRRMANVAARLAPTMRCNVLRFDCTLRDWLHLLHISNLRSYCAARVFR